MEAGQGLMGQALGGQKLASIPTGKENQAEVWRQNLMGGQRLGGMPAALARYGIGESNGWLT
jgi:hypothetical protein